MPGVDNGAELQAVVEALEAEAMAAGLAAWDV
jgi:hypothetical protein